MEDDKDALTARAEAVPVAKASVAPTVGAGVAREARSRAEVGPHVEAMLHPPPELVPCC
jgi:hypothetical protein